MSLFSTLTFAQVKKNIPKEKSKVIITNRDISKEGVKAKEDNPKGNKLEIGKINDRAAAALGFVPMMEANVGNTKIYTRIVPIDKIKATSKIDKKVKPKEKGTSEHDGLICKNYSVTLSPESESFDAPLADKMAYTYPGAGYNYNEYIKNNVQPREISSQRNPIILQVSSSSGNGKQKLVTDPTKNNLDEAVGQLKYSMPVQAPNLSTEVYVQSIVNDASFALNVEAGGGGFGFNVNAKFGIAYNSRKTYMSIDAKQKNYVITANLPTRAEGGFYQDAAENNSNENVFMSSVTYGRRVIGVIETELDQEQLAVGVKANYEGFGVNANLGLSILNQMNSAKTTIKLLFIGGNGDVITVPNPTEASVMAAINRWMTTTTSQSAVPIEYTFRNMRNVGMRWESVANNINYDQCIPKPPAAEAPKPWDITVTLNSISNNIREGVKLGIQQFANVSVDGNPKGENSGNNKPIICWMQDWSGCQTPPQIDFTKPHRLGTTYRYTVENDEMDRALFRVDTKRIVTYRTSAGGSKNDNVNIPKYDIILKNIANDISTFDVPVHCNGRIFSFNYTVRVMQRR